MGAVITDLWGEKVEHVKREPRNDREATYLRLLPTFASALQEKTRTCASFTKILANYISEESLITADYHKNIILQEPVRRETTEDSSIEFIGYWMPQHEQSRCTVLFTRHQSPLGCQAFSIF